MAHNQIIMSFNKENLFRQYENMSCYLNSKIYSSGLHHLVIYGKKQCLLVNGVMNACEEKNILIHNYWIEIYNKALLLLRKNKHLHIKDQMTNGDITLI